MKKAFFILISVCISVWFTVNANATLLDFNDQNNPGINSGADMSWNRT